LPRRKEGEDRSRSFGDSIKKRKKEEEIATVAEGDVVCTSAWAEQNQNRFADKNWPGDRRRKEKKHVLLAIKKTKEVHK